MHGGCRFGRPWRDSRNGNIAPVICGTRNYDPLEEGWVAAFSEKEDAVLLCERQGQISPPVEDLECFPDEVNFAAVGTGNLDPPWNNGWLYLNLDIADAVAGADDVSAAWVTTTMSALGEYQVGFPAVQMHNRCYGAAPTLNGTIRTP